MSQLGALERLKTHRLERPLTVAAGIPDYAPYLNGWDIVATEIGAAANHFSTQGLRPRLFGLRQHDTDQGIFPGTIVYATSLAMGSNKTVMGLNGGSSLGIPQLSGEFIESQIALERKVYDREPNGTKMEADERAHVLYYAKPAVDAANQTADWMEQGMDRRMAAKDAERALLSPAALEKRSIRDYALKVAGYPLWFRLQPVAEQKRLLALSEASGFMVDLWGAVGMGKDDFYEAVTRDVLVELQAHQGDIHDLHDPYRLGIATALHRNELTRVFGSRGDRSVQAELQFAEMMRGVTRGAFMLLLTRRMFNDVGKGSPAEQLVNAYSEYLDGSGMSAQAVQTAFDACRAHIRDVVVETARDVVEYAIGAPPGDIRVWVKESAKSQLPPPHTNKRKHGEMAKILTVNLADQIDAVASHKGRPSIHGLFLTTGLETYVP